MGPHRLATLLLLAAGCASSAGRLVDDPWPRTEGVLWQIAPKPAQLERHGPALVAFEGGNHYEATRVAPGVMRVRVARGELDTTPSVALVEGTKPQLEGADAEAEAALREAITNLQFSPGPRWRWFRLLEPGEAIVGLGERPGSFHQRGRRAVMWNSDHFAYSPDALRLYQSIPFFLSLKRGRATGFFLDDTYRLGFDVGVRRSNHLEVDADGGDFDLYLIDGPTVRDVIERYARLTGLPPMPPAWALGYQQCRWSYETQPRLLEVAHEFRRERIPCDAIYADIDYLDGFRSFTVSPQRFPDFPGMVRELASLGMHLVTILDPGLKRDPSWEIYREGHAAGHFVLDGSGAEYVGEVWAGPSVFPDFTREEVRRWWGGLYKKLVDAGVAGFWNDMNEPSVFDGPDKTMPEDNRHLGFGGGTHARFHNIYGMLMARATYEGVKALRPESRPFVLTRANYAGGQRYAATWTGDNRALWPELARSISMTLNLGMCGQPFAGPDIGGFDTGMEDGGRPYDDVGPELYARWLEFGALLPIARSHTIKGSMAREPYAFGEPWTSANRASIERRYRLLPLLYTLAEEAHRTGAPIVRPILWAAPEDEIALRTEDEFLLGDDLLVAPVTEPEVKLRTVYLPAGTWTRFDPNSPTAVHDPTEGGRSVQVSAPYGEIPMFARAGAVIPTGPVMQFVGEKPLDPLTLEVFAGRGEGSLYEDAGDGAGPFARTRYLVRIDGEIPVLTVRAREGAFVPPRRKVVVRFHLPGALRETSFEDDGSAREVRPQSP